MAAASRPDPGAGRWLDFPLRAVDLVRHTPKRFAVHVVADAVAAPVRRRMAERRSGPALSFAEAVRRGLGARRRRVLRAVHAQAWARGGDGLTTGLFRRRVSSGSSTAIIRKMLARHDRPGFWYPERGFGSICTALAAGVRGGGGVSCRPAVRLDRSSRVDDEVHVTLPRRSIGRPPRSVIVTIPSDLVAADARCATGGLCRRRRTRVPRRGTRLPHRTEQLGSAPFDAHYFPEPSTTVISRLSEPKQWAPGPTRSG